MIDTSRVDLTRMRTERVARLQREMSRQGLDALVLLGPSNQEYAGVSRAFSDAMRVHHEPVVVIVPRSGAPHAYTPYPEAAHVPPAHIHREIPVEYDDGVIALAKTLVDLLPGARRVGIDELTSPMMMSLAAHLPHVELVEAMAVTGAARICKTDDEVECIRVAQLINETAMLDVEAALRPGVRQNELSAIFLRRCFELGITWSCIDPIWNLTPVARELGTRTTTGDLGFPLASNDRFLREGDLIFCDTGVVWNGYHSDFGKVWICSVQPHPTPELYDCYRRWCDVIAAAYAAIKPGRTCGDVARDVAKVEPKHRISHFYLAHGAGCDSAEAPFIGSELGLEYEDTVVLAPNMTFVLEPVIWVDGVGGYRSEEVVRVTSAGCERMSTYGYTPFEGAR